MIRNTNIWKRVLTILTTGVLGITTVLFPSPYVSAMEEDDAIENVIQGLVIKMEIHQEIIKNKTKVLEKH